MSTIESRDRQDVHECQGNREECRDAPENHPAPSLGEDAAHGAEAAKRLCAFLGKDELELTHVVIEHVPASLNTCRDGLKESVVDMSEGIGRDSRAESDAYGRVGIDYETGCHK